MTEPDGDAPRDATLVRGPRLDRALGLERRQLAALQRQGRVRIVQPGERFGRAILDGTPHLRPGERAELVHAALDPMLLPEDIDLPVLHRDGALLFVDKPAGMAVAPDEHHPAGTLANALRGVAERDGEGLSTVEGPLRPGIVHRLDATTSGVMVVARSDGAHAHLASQFRAHTVERRYLALVFPAPAQAGEGAWPLGAERVVDGALARRRQGRKAYAVVDGSFRPASPVRAARTQLRLLAVAEDGSHALVEARPATGRTHQIRVHLAALGHPLVGDTLYGGAPARHLAHRLGLRRVALHAAHLAVDHPTTGARIAAAAPLPADLAPLVHVLLPRPAAP